MNVLRLGSRGSLLARTQSNLVADALKALHPDLEIQIIIIRTSGDQILDRPLYDEGGKGLFTKELELAILANEIDFAVHSYKDVPITLPLVDQSNLVIAAVPRRHDARDLLVSLSARSIQELRPKARVGTGSLRRRCQLLALRPDLQIKPIRGNIDTRLRKLESCEFDAIVLAVAGIERANLFVTDRMHPISLDELVPAAGQGALALQCRKDDAMIRQILAILNDKQTEECVEIERDIVRELGGDCHSPIGVIAQIEDNFIAIRGVVGGRDGLGPLARATFRNLYDGKLSAVKKIMLDLNTAGAPDLLRESKSNFKLQTDDI